MPLVNRMGALLEDLWFVRGGCGSAHRAAGVGCGWLGVSFAFAATVPTMASEALRGTSND